MVWVRGVILGKGLEFICYAFKLADEVVGFGAWFDGVHGGLHSLGY